MKVKLTVFPLWLVLVALMAIVLPGCSDDKEPSTPSSEHVAKNLQQLMNKLPMEWGMSPAQTKEAMEALNLSDFNQVSASTSSIMYANEKTSMYVVYGFEKYKLNAVLIAFPKNEDMEYDQILKNYLFLGYVPEEVYADPDNNRLISIYPNHIYTDDKWAALGFTMIDDI